MCDLKEINMYHLKYERIPQKWIDGLPIGNGRLAAMYWGDKQKDILSLNHERLWRGKYKGKEAPKNAHQLPELRRFLRERDYFRAGVFANLYFGGLAGLCSIGEARVDSYQPAGNLIFEISDNVTEAESNLDIGNGTITAKRNSGLKSTFFCDSNNGNVISKWNSETEFSGKLFFEREDDVDATYEITYRPNRILFSCKFICGINFSVQIALRTDGEVCVTDHGLFIKNAKVLICSTNILLNIKDERDMCLSFDSIHAHHCNLFSSYMNRVTFHLDQEDSDKPIDQRLAEFRNGAKDEKILELFYHYGRYLMVSSCICGELPPNLQGKWNNELQPKWKSDYHMDINFEMNEWLLESANLSEFAEPLTDFVLSFIESGRVAARNMFDCRGIWMPIFCDAWAECTPESYGYAVWVGVAAWMAQSLWQHYLYTGDKEYLRNKAYIFFKEVALFYEDFLVEDENGVVQIMPSQSPENRFKGAGWFVVSGICSSSAIDVQLAYDALSYAIMSAKVLNIDEDSREKWELLRSKLPPFAIGSDGRLMEWNEEFEEEWPGYKHLSHLYGLYPSDIFTPEKRPAEYQAAIKSFQYRMERQEDVYDGVGPVGWSRAWNANISARISDKEGFHFSICDIVKRFATESLLDTHPYPPKPELHIFQIDGNFGTVSAINEALCSYFDDKAHILQSLPDSWPKGSIGGLKLPGGHTIGFSWENGKVRKVEVIFGFAECLTLVINGNEITLPAKLGDHIVLDV